MSARVAPHNEDWTRRWLRAHRVPCEGDQLAAALAGLDGDQ
jgi:hypothetical protein